MEWSRNRDTGMNAWGWDIVICVAVVVLFVCGPMPSVSYAQAVDVEIVLTSLTGGEAIQSGQTVAITWTSIGVVDHVQLKYKVPGQKSVNIDRDAPNTGEFLWMVPDFATPVEIKIKIKARGPDNEKLAKDKSTETVSVVPPVVTLTATLGWDEVSAGDLSRYRVHWDLESGGGSDGIYVHSQDVGNTPTVTISALAPALQDGKTYFFVVTAIDFAGNESDFSNQIAVTFSATPIVGFTAATTSRAALFAKISTDTSAKTITRRF